MMTILENKQWIIVNPDNDLPHEQLPSAYKIHSQYVVMPSGGNDDVNHVPHSQEDLEQFTQEMRVHLPPRVVNVQSGDLVLKTLFVSVDPYLRIQFNKLHHSPAVPGKLQNSGSVLEVVYVGENAGSAYKVGDVVMGYYGWQQYAVVDAKKAADNIRKVNTSDLENVPVSTALGVLGMPGQTAYFCVKEVCKIKPGETVVVSGAAGAVGSLAVQIAKLKGAHVVGIVGSEEKKQYLLHELKCDAVINYKEANDMKKMKQALEGVCQKGIDVYLDNTGGYTTDAVLTMLNHFARVAIVGQISSYQNSLDETPQMEPRFLHRLIYNRATIQGFLVNDYNEREQEFLDETFDWIQSGKIKYSEMIREGFESIPTAFKELFQGLNTGKMVVKL